MRRRAGVRPPHGREWRAKGGFVSSAGRIPPGPRWAMTARIPTLAKALPAGRVRAGESGREQGSDHKNKAGIAGRLARRTGSGRAQATGAVEAGFAAIGEALAGARTCVSRGPGRSR